MWWTSWGADGCRGRARGGRSVRCHLGREAAPGEARRLCAPLQHRLLSLCSLPLPICAHPLVSQRIITIFGTWFEEKDSGICGLRVLGSDGVGDTRPQGPRWLLVRVPDPEAAGRPDPAGMSTLPPCTSQCELHFTSCQEDVFFPPFLVARAGCGLQEAPAGSGSFQLRNPSRSSQDPASLGWGLQNNDLNYCQ